MLETWRSLPIAARAGLAVMWAGLVLDVTLHGLGAAASPEHLVHAVVLAGMVLVIGGVIADGVGRTRVRQRSRA
ncbi:MAG TPA: hypothetical protein VKR80_04000 [Candidatus Limnocylindria bacterium]|nr:hypothetical protein [Candidatus Limnocylindria bacterium]